MAESLNVISMKSSLLTDEQLIKKRKNEMFAYMVGIGTQLLWAFNGVQVKSFQKLFPEDFTLNSVLFWRIMPVAVVAYFICMKKNGKITKHSELKHFWWFIIRNLGAYFSILLWIKSMQYFRISTVTVVGGCTPLIIIVLSIFFLGDTFYLRYIIGVLICIAGSAIIVFNDKKPQAKAQAVDPNMGLGIIIIVSNIFLGAFCETGRKVMVKDKMDLHEQNYFLAMYTAVPAGIVALFQRYFGFHNPKYVLYVASNSVFFYMGNFLTALALKYISMSKFQPISYLNIVFTFIISFLLLGEPIFFTDIIGAIFIVGFQYYNMRYPVGRQINEITKEKEQTSSIQK